MLTTAAMANLGGLIGAAAVAQSVVAQAADAERAAVELQWTWMHAPQSWGVFVLLAALVAAVWSVVAIYRREQASCPASIRGLLSVLRTAALACVGLVLLGPARVEIERRTILPPLALVRDASQSMSTADRYAGGSLASAAADVVGQSVAEFQARPATRAQLVEAFLARDEGRFVRELRARSSVRVGDFAERLQPSSGVALDPSGRATDVTLAIREALEAPVPVAVVMFSDGQHTGRDDPRDAARSARQLGVPLFIVGMGDASRPRNLRLVHVDVRPQVWKDEPFDIEVLVAAQGLAGDDHVVLEIVEQRLAQSGELSAPTVVARQPLAVPSGNGQVRHTATHTRAESGRFVYSARLAELAGEQATGDNQLASSPVQVLDRESVRVLLVSGGPNWDYQLLERLLSRDRTITVSCWLQSLDEERAQAGTHPIGRLPATREELFWYDVVILLDPDPRELDAEWLGLLKQFVGEHAGGVLFMTGPQYSGRTLTMSRAEALRDLLPIRMADARAVELATLPTSQPRAWPLRVVAGNADHPLLRLGADAASGGTKWEQLPGIYWSFPALEPKPTSTLLVEHSDPSLRSSAGPRPLVVAGRFGAGHTLYLGFHSAWRWRSQGRQAEFYDRFWVQAVRYLVEGRALEGRRRGTLRTDRERYELGDKVVVSTRLQDVRFKPLSLPQIDAVIVVGERTAGSVVLRAVAGQAGQYEGTFVPKELGRHTVRIDFPPDETGEPVRLEAAVGVDLPARETAEPWLNEPLLRDLTQLSDGRYFTLADAAELPRLVPDRREVIELRRPPEPLWDRPWLLGTVVALLAAEWLVRKWYRLL